MRVLRSCLVSCARGRNSDSRDLLLDLVDEVELDALGWHLVHHRLTFFVEELGVSIVAIVVGDLDDAVVLKAALKSSFGGFRMSGLADVHSPRQERRLQQPRVDFAKVLVNMERTHPVTLLETVLVAIWRICEWRVEAVKMPVLAAEVACDDRAFAQR